MCDESAANDLVHKEGLSMEEVSHGYTKWAEKGTYEFDLRRENYKGPIIAADATAKEFPDKSERSTLRILDIAAGSGFVAEELKARGFEHIDALEPSEGMLKLAKEKGLYEKYFHCFMNGEKVPVESNSYDIAITSGGMGEGHIPCSAMDEFARVVKPGGLAIIAMRAAYLESVKEYKGRLEPKMKQMEHDGIWETVSRTVVPRYSFENDGIVYIFRVKK